MFRTIALLCALLAVGSAAAEEGIDKTELQEAPNDSLSAPHAPVHAEHLAKREAQKQAIRAMRDAALERLFKAKPKLREEIDKAEGYAVFDARQTNVLLLVTGKGHGLVVDNASQHETFMKMGRLGTGPGLGRKVYKQILVFKNRGLLEQFISVGADISASADALVKPSAQLGGIVLNGVTSLNPLLSVYQITERGILIQANWGGVGYLPDKELNDTARPAR